MNREKASIRVSHPDYRIRQKSFASHRNALHQEIQPNSVIECELDDDFAVLLWDILRLRRLRSEIINGAFFEALQDILKQLLPKSDYDGYLEHERAAEDFARGWFEGGEARTEVAGLLRQQQLDETAIEAEAFRSRAVDLECLDRMLASALARRDKALYVMAEYRHSLAKVLQQASDHVLEQNDVPQLVASRSVRVDDGKREADRC